MAELEEAGRHAIAGAVEVDGGLGGLTRIRMTTAEATAEVYLQGATVTAYRPRDSAPVLFLSQASRFQRGAAIRGGVPVVFPWFGPHATVRDAPMHGFARNATWRVVGSDRDAAGACQVTLELTPDLASHPAWSHPYRLRYRVGLARALEMALEVENPGTQPFTVEEALHTYLAVADIREAAVHGLAGTIYADKVDGMRRKTQGPEPIRFTGETDRVYLHTGSTCTLEDPGGRRRVVVEKEASRTTVVWNPWIEKARAAPDLQDDEWQRMVCIETANAMDNRLVLPPGARHTLQARLRLE
jgi:D-hexose-6-phosphate mutarotase